MELEFSGDFRQILKYKIPFFIVVIPCVSHAAQHPVHTLQTEAHIANAQQQF
jgi:hypothetical protein